MLRRTKPPIFFLLIFACLACFACVPGAPALQVAPPTTSAHPPERQLPLDVDRDPFPSPDDGTSPTQKPQKVEKDSGGGFIIRKDVSEVLLNVTVLDDHQRLVSSLGEKDFKVYEDGVPQTISVYRHEDMPVSLGILVDDSGSMSSKRAAVTKSALDLVRLSNPQDETFIVNFADEPFLDQDFTNDISKLNDGLNHIDSRGGTALYDAVLASADHLSQAAKRSRQALLIITDGDDLDSSATLEETVRHVQDLGGPVVYAIGLLFGDQSRAESRKAQRTLDLLAKETGGAAYFPKTLADVDGVAAEVARDIRNQYVLGYHSTKAPELGGFRRVQVEVKAKGYGRLSVRTRTGYYPTKDKPPAKTK